MGKRRGGGMKRPHGKHSPQSKLVTLHQPPPVPLCLPHSTLSSSIYMKTKQEKMLRLTESIFLP